MNPGTTSSSKKRVQVASPAREPTPTVSQPDASINSLQPLSATTARERRMNRRAMEWRELEVEPQQDWFNTIKQLSSAQLQVLQEAAQAAYPKGQIQQNAMASLHAKSLNAHWLTTKMGRRLDAHLTAARGTPRTSYLDTSFSNMQAIQTQPHSTRSAVLQSPIQLRDVCIHSHPRAWWWRRTTSPPWTLWQWVLIRLWPIYDGRRRPLSRRRLSSQQ